MRTKFNEEGLDRFVATDASQTHPQNRAPTAYAALAKFKKYAVIGAGVAAVIVLSPVLAAVFAGVAALAVPSLIVIGAIVGSTYLRKQWVEHDVTAHLKASVNIATPKAAPAGV